MQLIMFVFFTVLALYTGAVWSKEVLSAAKKVDRFLDKITGTSKRQRRRNLKEKYGFDDSYDKYIA